MWEGHCRGGYKHARCAWSTVFGSGPKCFSLVLDLGADAGVMVDCMTWVASEILAPLTSLGSCRRPGWIVNSVCQSKMGLIRGI